MKKEDNKAKKNKKVKVASMQMQAEAYFLDRNRSWSNAEIALQLLGNTDKKSLNLVKTMKNRFKNKHLDVVKKLEHDAISKIKKADLKDLADSVFYAGKTLFDDIAENGKSFKEDNKVVLAQSYLGVMSK